MRQEQAFRDFSPEEHGTWRTLFSRQEPLRDVQLVPRFSEGLSALGIDGQGVPDLEKVNRRLRERTGFRGVPVAGFEAPAQFFEMLARREFPVGNFIRDGRDLNYTPAPDVFHDLYGHLPFLAREDYADFCQRFGACASRYGDDSEALTRWDRLFWFTIEFALQETPAGRRILGAGIASSFTECAYSLSEKPEVLPFEVERIRDQEFRIDELQRRLFVVRSEAELFGCLDRFEESIRRPGTRVVQRGKDLR